MVICNIILVNMNKYNEYLLPYKTGELVNYVYNYIPFKNIINSTVVKTLHYFKRLLYIINTLFCLHFWLAFS